MKKREIRTLYHKHRDLYERAIAIEDGAMPNLITVKGLGRNWSWRDFVEADMNQTAMCWMIDVNNLCFSYGKEQNTVLKRIDFSAADGSITAVLGINGAGKSTLLKCINRILHAGCGDIRLDGKSSRDMSNRELAKRIAYVPQTIGKSETTVYDMVLLGRKPYIKWDVTQDDHEIVKRILKKLNLEKYAVRSIATLSGGEAQKVMLARALAQEPRVLLLDEPTSSLDPKNQHEVLELVQTVTMENGLSTICVVHDLNLAVRYCDNYLFIKDGEVYAYGGREIVTPETIETVYRIHTHIIEHMGIPVIIPLPKVPTNSAERGTNGSET